VIRYNHTKDEPAREGKKGEVKMRYSYGMRLRGFSIGCQPMNGFIEAVEDTSNKYWNIIIYDRQLTEEEENHYSLDYLGRLGD